MSQASAGYILSYFLGVNIVMQRYTVYLKLSNI